jgi:hypothetical protein
MLKICEEELDDLEGRYPGFREAILRFEEATLPHCPSCGADHTADVQCGITGRTINIAAATTKFKLVPNAPPPERYFCNGCDTFFDVGSNPATVHIDDEAIPDQPTD